jgi:acetylornithine deacetylase/succinyl-diaminopimelate desuccinylase-like protein
VLGPGDISGAHSALEYAPIDQIRQAVEIYIAAAEMLLK